MNKDWEYKRFDELMTPAKVERCGDREDLPVLSITMRGGIVKQRERFNKTIASTDTSNYKVVKDGQLVIAFPIDEGLLYTQDVAKEGIMSPAYNIWDVDYSKIDRRFLVSYFHSRFAFSYYKTKLRGSTQRRRSMDKADLLSMPIPVPPLAVQHQIVAEMDLLNGAIEKQKAQLEELDKLAQSIFYDMFGDPVTNEKGWDVRVMEEVCEITSSKRVFANEYCDSGIPFYRGKEITETSKGKSISSELFISKERYKDIKNEYGVPAIGDILITAVGTIGNIWVVNDNEPFYFKDGNIVWLKNIKIIDSTYFRNILSILIDAYKYEMANGCAYNALTIANLKRMSFSLPPLSLQQEFASKIEAIESMKAKVRQSLSEAETLFNSRMDYYFN